MEFYLENEDSNHIDDNPWDPVYDKSNNFDFLKTLNTKIAVGRTGETSKGKEEGPESHVGKKNETGSSNHTTKGEHRPFEFAEPMIFDQVKILPSPLVMDTVTEKLDPFGTQKTI